MFRNYNRQVDSHKVQQMTQQMFSVLQDYHARYKNKMSEQDTLQVIQMLLVPMMTNILTKYNEDDFHRVMNQSYTDELGHLSWGFDFIGDWRRNHTMAFNMAMPFVRMMGLRINTDILTQLVEDIIRSWGWQLKFIERDSLRHTIKRMKRLVNG